MGTAAVMQPLPEVQAATDRLSALTDELDLLKGLDVLTQVVSSLIPSIVGVSLTVVLDGEAFTVTATSEDVGALDATQYLDGGPCVEATNEGCSFIVDDMLDEDRWQLYRDAAATQGVRASLSLPLGGAGGRTPGAINLYASDAEAFRGKEAVLAEAFQTPADEFVTNADLTFMTRDAARGLPEQIEAKAKVDQAVGVLGGLLGWSPDDARGRLRRAASQANTPVDKVADLIVALSAA